MIDYRAVEREAEAELEAETFREEVAKAKARIIAERNKPFWKRLFPFKITITRN